MSDQPEDYRPSQIDRARRKRRSFGYVPTTKGDRAVFMSQLAERLVANADFYLFSFLCGLVLVVAILLDSPAMYILAALLAPFMAPVVGLGFATVVGSLRFFLQSLGSLLIGAALVFVTGILGGWISKLFPNLKLVQPQFHLSFTFPDFVLLTIGSMLAIYITVKAPKSRSLVASVALAYEIYIPIAVAGFGLTSEATGFFPQGLKLAAIWLAWVIFLGTVFLAVLKIHPSTVFGYLLTACVLAVAVYTLVNYSNIGTTLQSQLQVNAATGITKSPTAPVKNILASDTPVVGMTDSSEPSPTAKATQVPGTVVLGEATPTNTIPPTQTATMTITPKPTAFYAKTYSQTSATGVRLRKTPGGDYLEMVKIDTLVEVLGTEQTADGYIWVHVRVVETGDEGWIIQSLLLTATPAANW